jgi:hypothetical protein
VRLSVREAGGIRGAPLFLWGMCTCYLRVTQSLHCKRDAGLTVGQLSRRSMWELVLSGSVFENGRKLTSDLVEDMDLVDQNRMAGVAVSLAKECTLAERAF